MSAVDSRATRRVRALGRGLVAGMVIVTVVAAVISYGHMYSLALHSGQNKLNSLILPFSIDGLLAVSATYLVIGAMTGRRDGRIVAWFLTILTIVASLAANVASSEPTLTARLISGWPPIAFTGGLELAIRHFRGSVRSAVQDRAVLVPDDVQNPTPGAVPTVPEPARDPASRAPETVLETPAEVDQRTGPDLGQQQDQGQSGDVPETVPAPPAEPVPAPRPRTRAPRPNKNTTVPPAARPRTAPTRVRRTDDELASVLAGMDQAVLEDTSLRVLAAELHVGKDRAARVLDLHRARTGPSLTLVPPAAEDTA